MNLSEFSSVLQLGVGLHAGTALLQSILEFASAPIFARVDRLVKVAELRVERLRKANKPAEEAYEILSELNDIRGLLALKRVQFFHEYKLAAGANAIVAVALYGFLCWAALQADYKLGVTLAVFLIVLSALPAVGSIAILWWRWRANTSSVVEQIAKCQRALF